jgi:light-regulated signal transduction histidine kinase (bacteriophytochrome)
MHVAIHCVAALGLLFVAVTGRIAYRTARAFPTYAERVARAVENPVAIAERDGRPRSERLGRITAAVGRVTTYVTVSVVLSLTLLLTSHLLLVREIYRREHIERELHDANRELESFSYSVSHDLRAPLRSIDGFSQALVEDAGPALAPEARSHLDRIRTATQRMGQLIDDLIGLSKVSRSEMKHERIDLTDLVGQIVVELRRQNPDRQVDVLVRQGMTATGDPQLVRLALQNLIENAWKFTARRPRATIDIGQSRDEDGVTAFYVGDNGAGFDSNYADKLFGPFQRLHSVSDFPGTGIGLATVQRIVHRHGGHIWAEGHTDQGACFYFTLG